MKKLLSCLLLVLPFFGMSQKYVFQSYSTEEGLPQTQVTAFCQDDDGYLWVGTLGGLAKFNGKEFTSFLPEDGLLNSRIQSLFFNDGKIWVGHDGGVSRIENGRIDNIKFSGTNASRNVSQIIRYKGKIITCSDRGGGLYEVVNDRFKAIPLPRDKSKDSLLTLSVRSAVIYGEYLYLATGVGILKTKDLKTFEYDKNLLECSYTGVEVNDDYIYFISEEKGIYYRDLKTNKISHFTSEEVGKSLSGGELDAKGTLWIYSSDAVVTVSDNKIRRFVNEVSGLPVNNAISSIFSDHYGNIWMGSDGKGMFRFPGEQFAYYDRSTGHFSDLFLTGFETKNGSFYFGSYDGGVIKESRSGKKTQIDIGHPLIWASQPNVDGFNWFGTQVSMVSLDQNDQPKIYTEADGLPGKKITSFYKVGPREMYIGGNDGIALYKNGVITNLSYDGMIDIGTVRDFVRIGETLMISSNLGLFEYKDGKFSSFGSVDDVCYTIELDNYGSIWYGTESGLYQLKNGKTKRIELRKNPGSNFINFINHKDGKLYVGSNNGLFLISNLNSAEPKVVRYGLSEGLVNLETNLNSGFFDRKGIFWFGTATGLMRFNPDLEGSNKGNPRFKIKTILLNYEDFDFGTYSELDKSGFPKHLNLPFSKNNLIFELDGISLANHKGLNYQFYLEGLNEDWSPLTNNAIITFTSLPSGEYLLRMRCVDIDGRTSDEVTVPFTIRSPFYKTWWFIGLCILAGAGLVILFFRFRVRRINAANEKEKLEFKSRLLSLEQQSMNASMNRHFVFNSLNSIQYFINTRDRLSANKYLTNFAKLIRKNLDTATVDGNMITLDEELERIELYLSLESMRFKDRFNYEINADGIETDSILIPAMILQPFVENSIIHGILPNLEKKGHIALNVEEENGYLLLSVEDNGIGVNQSMTNKVDMEGDHRSKGMEITSKRIDLIQKISNDDISLVGPYEIYNDDRSIKGTRVLLKIPLHNLDN
ncbi:MAG: two-component regulator propeller domain-containing protein [Crocinitomicaceae bacterium]|nr:two-component regulator propeller domain-containing protein [Crocinitomicaceae bacterium]